MKRALVAAALVAAGLAVAPFVQVIDAPDRPSGVAKEAWIPIGGRVGGGVVASSKGPVAIPPQALLLALPVSGYFMLKSPSVVGRLIAASGRPVAFTVRGPACVTTTVSRFMLETSSLSM
jgi:hypothetical protein